MERALIETLHSAWRTPVRLIWTENRTVYLSLRRDPAGTCIVRLHHCFREAPAPVWKALERFLLSGGKAHLEPARAFFGARRVNVLARSPQLCSRGRFHQLRPILEELRSTAPFVGLPEVGVTWGPRVRPGLRSIRLGCYLSSGGEAGRALIRIHRLLDRPEVPGVAVAQVVHHELIHHYLACTFGPSFGRRHSREFRRWEAAFPSYADALEWQRSKLPGLIDAVRRPSRSRKEGRLP